MKKIIRSISLALTLVLLTSAASYAKDGFTVDSLPYATGSLEGDRDAGYQNVAIVEDGQYVQVSSLYGNFKDKDGRPDYVLCTNATSGDCSKPEIAEVRGVSLLPVCGDVVENCIKSVEVYGAGKAPQVATLVKQVPGFRSDGDPALGIPRGTGVSVFSAKDSPHTGGSDYAVMASLGWSYRPGAVGYEQLRIKVAGTTEQAANAARLSYPGVCTAPAGAFNAGQRTPCIGPGGPSCVYTLEGICGKEQDLAPDTRIKLTLQVSKQLTGWFQGRLKDPSVEIASIDSKYNLLTIDAASVSVPRLHVKYDTKKFGNVLDGMNFASAGADNRLLDASGEFAREVIKRLSLADKDTASGISTLWTVGTVNSGGNRCMSDSSKVVGFVTTNSMAYLGSAPDFVNGMLNYKVAGTHFLPDGKTLNEGTYDLVMRSEIARCLYGFSKAPISASISVVSDQGENKVATTVVSEKDGWLHLAAYGFTFSSPTISVKLSQAAAPVPKKTTIACVSSKNNKLTKKVTGVGPKCPSGYKKK
ncbi:MAG: hypothetical protein ORN27_00200 [Rhodoluna sp.]|nr:hypothetical protein [Rhodoluna sp.]